MWHSLHESKYGTQRLRTLEGHRRFDSLCGRCEHLADFGERDEARSRREEERISRVARATQRQLALDCQSQLSLPAAVLGGHTSTILLAAIMEARSAKFR